MSPIDRRFWSHLVVAFCAGWLLASPALAGDPPADIPPVDPAPTTAAPAAEPAVMSEPEEPDALGRLDTAFGDWVVAPLGGVLFWDVAFWDNTLPLGEGIGTEANGEVVTGYSPGDGYAWAKQIKLPPEALIVPVLDTPIMRREGSIEVAISTEGGKIKAEVTEQQLDLAALGIMTPELPEGFVPAGPAIQTIDDPTIAPFPFQVDLLTGKTLPSAAPMAKPTLEVVAGMKVWTTEGEGLLISRDPAAGSVVQLSETRSSLEPLPNTDQMDVPIVVLWLLLGALFFTLRMTFISFRAFFHAIRVVIGDYDDPNEPGEISHFQALSSALSATVGLGNIAGVAVAISAGGPGAVFWMVVAALLGMNAKFVEVTLGQMYRVVRADGSISGGPMHYLKDGLAELGLGPLGKVLSVMFALMCVGGSFGGGNMFQANQSYAAVVDATTQLGLPVMPSWLYGIVLAFFVGLVIIGGIKRIGQIAGVIVPVMCGVYVVAGLWILLANAAEVPAALGVIVNQAFNPVAVGGGFIGVMMQGFRRAAFSNEAGVGSASIAHSAASTSEPVREGVVALLEPFIDTVIVCTMTGLVVVVSGSYKNKDLSGIEMTSEAFGSAIGWFPVVLSFAVLMFAFSTMISWSYYGERCTTFLLGDWAVTPYRVVFLFFVWFGSIASLDNVIGFSDLMILGMAFPNILGAVLLSNKVRSALDVYWGKLQRGEFKVYQS